MSEAEKRKTKSIKILKQHKVPYINHLPVIDDTKSSLRRDIEEVAFRAIALCIVALKGEGLEQKEVEQVIHRFNVFDKFTNLEKQFIQNASPDKLTSIQFLWRYEAYWVLLWALGFIDKLGYPNHICNVPLAVSILADKNNTEEFINSAILREQNLILDEADLIYRYNWAVVNSKIKGKAPPSLLDKGVVLERHYTLNWLYGYHTLENSSNKLNIIYYFFASSTPSLYFGRVT